MSGFKMKFKKVFASFLCTIVSLPAIAEDIELYVNHNVETDEKSRVLMIFDTSRSMMWDIADGEKCYNEDSAEIECFSRKSAEITCFGKHLS